MSHDVAWHGYGVVAMASNLIAMASYLLQPHRDRTAFFRAVFWPGVHCVRTRADGLVNAWGVCGFCLRAQRASASHAKGPVTLFGHTDLESWDTG